MCKYLNVAICHNLLLMIILCMKQTNFRSDNSLYNFFAPTTEVVSNYFLVVCTKNPFSITIVEK